MLYAQARVCRSLAPTTQATPPSAAQRRQPGDPRATPRGGAPPSQDVHHGELCKRLREQSAALPTTTGTPRQHKNNGTSINSGQNNGLNRHNDVNRTSNSIDNTSGTTSVIIILVTNNRNRRRVRRRPEVDDLQVLEAEREERGSKGERSRGQRANEN